MSDFFVAYRQFKKPLDDEIEREKLSVVRMSRELYIDLWFSGFFQMLGLMIHEDKCCFWIGFLHDLWERFSLKAKPGRRYVFASDERDASDFFRFIPEEIDAVIGDVFRRTVDAADVFMVTCYTKNTVFRIELLQIFPEIATYHRIDFAIEDISWKEYQIGFQVIDLLHDASYITDAIDGSEMDVARDDEAEAFVECVFLIQDDRVMTNRWHPCI